MERYKKIVLGLNSLVMFLVSSPIPRELYIQLILLSKERVVGGRNWRAVSSHAAVYLSRFHPTHALGFLLPLVLESIQ
jgi:hypothetical protein